MRRWAIVTGVLIGTSVAGATMALAIGRSIWNRDTGRAVAALPGDPGLLDGGAEAIRGASFDSLPPPVARYFTRVLPAEGGWIRSARVEWGGEFRMRPGGGWAPFEAVQHFTSRPPGFVWDARIRMLPLLSVRVRDSYRSRAGMMLARVAGLVTVVDEGHSPEMAQSALARWLGEAVWFPTALLPGGGIHWEAVDDSTARATVMDGPVSASAEFHFAPTGEITGMTAMRYRDVEGAAVLTPFAGSYGDYVRRAGVLVPATAEVAWLLPEGRFHYWRGRLEEVDYEVVEPG